MAGRLIGKRRFCPRNIVLRCGRPGFRRTRAPAPHARKVGDSNFVARLSAPIARQVRGCQRAENIRPQASQKKEKSMERKIAERRTVLKGGAAALGMLGSGTSVSMVAGAKQASADTPLSSVPDQILTAFQRFRETIPANFDHEYVEKVVRPFFLTSFYEGERPMLPMIDVDFSKENALPYDLWGLITRDWRPTPEDGVTVFLQGLEKRGPNNLRKRIYFTGVTPDLYKPMYSAKVVAFFDKLMDQQFANKPFMRHYLDYYFDLYWDLHLGVTGDAIPFEVRQIGEAFNTVLAYRNPLLPITHDNYM